MFAYTPLVRSTPVVRSPSFNFREGGGEAAVIDSDKFVFPLLSVELHFFFPERASNKKISQFFSCDVERKVISHFPAFLGVID